MDHAVCDRVNGPVRAFGGEVVERDHRGLVACEIVFQGEDLSPVAQRTLRQQPDFRKTVDDDALRLVLFDRLEHALDGFAEFEVGRIEQTLMLIGIEHAFRPHQFADADPLVDAPAVRSGSLPEFLFGFRKADIEAGLADRRAGKEKLQGDGGLSSARGSFQKVKAVSGEPALEDVVESRDTGVGARQYFLSGDCHRVAGKHLP